MSSHSGLPKPGCQTYQFRLGFVLDDLDSKNHLDLARWGGACSMKEPMRFGAVVLWFRRRKIFKKAWV